MIVLLGVGRARIQECASVCPRLDGSLEEFAVYEPEAMKRKDTVGAAEMRACAISILIGFDRDADLDLVTDSRYVLDHAEV